MLLRVNDPVVVGPRNDFGELWVLADNGAGAGIRTIREGIVVGPTDFNPERIQLEDDIVLGATPNANVSDRFTTAAVGVLDYNFGNFELQLTSALTRVDSGLVAGGHAAADRDRARDRDVQRREPLAGRPAREVRAARGPDRRQPARPRHRRARGDPGQRRAGEHGRHGCDAHAPAADRRDPGSGRADVPVPSDRPGGRPGRRAAGRQHPRRLPLSAPTAASRSSTGRAAPPITPNAVTGRNNKVQLQYSPGRIDPLNPAWAASRKPLAAEFRYRGQTIFVIVNHFNSKGGDQPLFGRFQPPARLDGGAAPPAGAGRERLRRRDPRGVQEREDRRARRHQRLRVLPDGGAPEGRRAHEPDGHAAEARAVLLRLRGELAGARPGRSSATSSTSARRRTTSCTSTPSSSTRRATTTRRSPGSVFDDD